MANKKTTTGRDRERLESGRAEEREGFGDTSGPQVSGTPTPPSGSGSTTGNAGAADDPGEAGSPEAGGADRPVLAERMEPLDAGEVGTRLTEPGEPVRKDDEEARNITGDLPEDRPGSAAPEGLPGTLPPDTATDTGADAAPPPGDEPTRTAAPWAAGAPAAADAAVPDRPGETAPAGDMAAPRDDAASRSPEPGTGVGGAGGYGGGLGGHDDGQRDDGRRDDGQRDGGPRDDGRRDDGQLHDEPADEAGRSFASTLLLGLVLLIAGAAIGIWAAPRIAPHLPAGMAPVADWLSPRDPELENRIAALEAETGAAVTELRAEVERLAAETGDTADLDARLAAIEAGVEDRIGALGEDLAALDGAETRDRLSRLEAAVEGHQETLTSLRDQLAGVDVGEATAQQFDAYEAELAGMRGEFRDVAGQVGTLSRRIDEVAAQAERQIEIARTRVEEVEAEAAAGLTRAEIEADLAEIRSALAAGAPYEEPVERLATRTDAGVPDGLAAPAASGVPTLAGLRQEFPDAATRAIRADVQARAQDDFVGRLRGFAEAQVATRSLAPREGDDADAILSRMEAALRQDDLGTALSEAEALPPEASDAMSDWLQAARTRHSAIQGYEQVQADLSAMN
jgi:hypothetical protein